MVGGRSPCLLSPSPPTSPTLPAPRPAPQGTPAGPTLAQPALSVQHQPPACGAPRRLAADDAGGGTVAPLAVRLGVFPRLRRRRMRRGVVSVGRRVWGLWKNGGGLSAAMRAVVAAPPEVR